MAEDRRQRRFYVPHLPQPQAGDDPDARLALPPGEAHHAVHVLRLGVGEQVELFDGSGLVAAGRIVAAKKSDVVVAIERVRRAAGRPGAAVHLAFAVPKGNRLDWLLEKATELAAASLRPVVFERSVAGGGELSDAKRQRWLGQCIAAAKQSGLNFLPQIHPPADLDEAIQAAAGLKALFGDLSPQALPIAQALAGGCDGRDMCIFVGPEGGLTDGERGRLIGAGVVPVRLGGSTLRTETAAIAMLAAAVALAH